MNKAFWLKCTVLLLPVLILLQLLSGIFHDSLGDRLFAAIHLGGGLLMLVVGCVHMTLNWGWISKQIFHKK